jgi:two-component system sensor histidine kinase PilS (NtrC family)
MVDVVYYTVLIYFTGGGSSPFSLIYIFPIISSGILHFRRGALLIASASALLFGLLINLEQYGILPDSGWPWVPSWAGRSPGYALWVMVVNFTVYFLTAMLSSSITEQLQRTRVSLNLRETDYRRLSELHSSIVRSIPSGIATTDAEDRITFVNASGTRLLGRSLSDLIGLPISEVFPVIDDGVSASSVRRRTFGTVKEIHGQKARLDVTVSDLKGNDEVPSGRLVIFEDVTHLRSMEDRVKASERQAALARVAASMAHEIRNPLAAVRGAAELLAQSSSGLTEEKKLLNIITRESDRLNSLIGDFVLTVTPGRTHRNRVMLNALVEETAGLFSKDATVNGRITLHTLVDKQVEVEGDSRRLKQALWHLLLNAAEAGGDGGVIRVTLESKGNSGQAVVKVQDSGPGIPPEIRDRIFEPFTTTKEGRKGLGLAIVLSIAEAHNGTIDIETAPTGGTVFVLRLPLASAESDKVQGVKQDESTPPGS